MFAGGGDRREAEAAEAQTAATSAAAHQVPDVTVLACWFTFGPLTAATSWSPAEGQHAVFVSCTLWAASVIQTR